MISKDDCKYITAESSQFAFSGNSDDKKPTGTYEGRQIATGSTFFEWDTASLWRYDGGEWKQLGGAD